MHLQLVSCRDNRHRSGDIGSRDCVRDIVGLVNYLHTRFVFLFLLFGLVISSISPERLLAILPYLHWWLQWVLIRPFHRTEVGRVVLGVASFLGLLPLLWDQIWVFLVEIVIWFLRRCHVPWWWLNLWSYVLQNLIILSLALCLFPRWLVVLWVDIEACLADWCFNLHFFQLLLESRWATFDLWCWDLVGGRRNSHVMYGLGDFPLDDVSARLERFDCLYNTIPLNMEAVRRWTLHILNYFSLHFGTHLA